MSKILSISQAIKVAQNLKKGGKSIVLVGGCFDILHSGHTLFLEKAKEQGDLLFLILESDENIRKKKGENRPINSQKNRSIVLSTLSSVDYVITLKGVTKNEEYDKLIVQIQPDVIAMTKGDKGIERRKIQCELVGAELKLVTEIVEGKSTTDLIKEIKN